MACVEALEASHSFPFCLSFGDSACDVVLRGLVNFGSDEDSLVEDAVELSISSA